MTFGVRFVSLWWTEELYTDDVKRLFYEAKARLPKDFELATRDVVEGPAAFICIVIDMKQFEWRTVEDRLAIAMTLERLRQLVKETGIECVIEKT